MILEVGKLVSPHSRKRTIMEADKSKIHKATFPVPAAKKE